MAVILTLDAPVPEAHRGPYAIQVRSLDGAGPDTTLMLTASDTAIVTIRPASYTVAITGVPASCGVRGGDSRLVTVPRHSNTTVARFSLVCQNALTLITLTDGLDVDSAFTYLLEGPNALVRVGAIAANDTLRIDPLPTGGYSASLRAVAPNCQVLSDPRPVFVLTEAGGVTQKFRVSCADERHRPRIIAFQGSQLDGTIGFYLRVADPDRDVDRYFWDVTDCAHHSELPDGVRWRDQLLPHLVEQGSDTVTLVGAFAAPPASMSGSDRCQVIYVGDRAGNLSPAINVSLGRSEPQIAPHVTTFNAYYLGRDAIRVRLEVAPQRQSVIGAFVVYLLRDGVTADAIDGRPDPLVFFPAGLPLNSLPDIQIGWASWPWYDYLGAYAVVVDADGNMTMAQDMDLFR